SDLAAARHRSQACRLQRRSRAGNRSRRDGARWWIRDRDHRHLSAGTRTGSAVVRWRRSWRERWSCAGPPNLIADLDVRGDQTERAETVRNDLLIAGDRVV